MTIPTTNANVPNIETTQEIEYLGSSYDGSIVGPTTAGKVGFYGTTPIVRRTSLPLSSVGTSQPTSTAPFGFSTSSQGNMIVTMLNEIIATLNATTGVGLHL